MVRKEKGKNFFFALPLSMYQQLVSIQYSILKKEKRRISIAALVRDAIAQYLERKKEG